jgi:hypothetical protein
MSGVASTQVIGKNLGKAFQVFKHVLKPTDLKRKQSDLRVPDLGRGLQRG